MDHWQWHKIDSMGSWEVNWSYMPKQQMPFLWEQILAVNLGYFVLLYDISMVVKFKFLRGKLSKCRKI